MEENKLLNGAVAILKEFKRRGYKAYIVGGFVRDNLLGNDAKDIDITTNALPSTVVSIFPDSFNKSDKFKTVTVRFNEEEYEVTTFRTDHSYKDHRHPKTHVSKTLKGDIKRRDFTINTLCYDENLKLIDFFDGENDLRNGLIKTVGKPLRRFNEDALRMFRCFRFSSRYNFKIDENTYNAICNLSFLTKYISKERIIDELSKMINEPYFKDNIDLIVKSNILMYYKPLEKALIYLKNNYTNITLIELVALSSFIKGEYDDSLLLSKKDIKQVKDIFRISNMLASKNVNYKEFFDFSEDLLDSSIKILSIMNNLSYKKEEIMEYYNNLPLKKESDLAIDGNGIKKALKISESPRIKEIIGELIKAVEKGLVKNTKKDLNEYIINNISL